MTRLRVTAFPPRLETTNPKRDTPGLPSATTRTTPPLRHRRPSSRTLRKSRGLRRVSGSGSESLPALASPRGQCGAAGAGPHAVSKSVAALTPANLRLIRSLHDEFLGRGRVLRLRTPANLCQSPAGVCSGPRAETEIAKNLGRSRKEAEPRLVGPPSISRPAAGAAISPLPGVSLATAWRQEADTVDSRALDLVDTQPQYSPPSQPSGARPSLPRSSPNGMGTSEGPRDGRFSSGGCVRRCFHSCESSCGQLGCRTGPP